MTKHVPPDIKIIEMCGSEIFAEYSRIQRDNPMSGGDVDSGINSDYRRLGVLNNVINYFTDLRSLLILVSDTLSFMNTEDLEKQCHDIIDRLRLLALPENRKTYLTIDIVCLLLEINIKKYALKTLASYLTDLLEEYDMTVNAEDMSICKICYQNHIDTLIVNCRHTFCGSCVDELCKEILPKCPICNEVFALTMEFYI